MRLFGKVDGAINRFDRAMWLTCPFDLALSAPVQLQKISPKKMTIKNTSTIAALGITRRKS